MHRAFYRRYTTTTWKCLISGFVEDVNTRQRLSFSFPELWYSLLKFNTRKKCQHLTNWTSWNKRDKVWSRVNSLFKWRFSSRRSRCCLSSLITLTSHFGQKLSRNSVDPLSLSLWRSKVPWTGVPTFPDRFSSPHENLSGIKQAAFI